MSHNNSTNSPMSEQERKDRRASLDHQDRGRALGTTWGNPVLTTSILKATQHKGTHH